MKSEMYLIGQAVDVLIKSATHMKDYGRELETLDDVASVLNTLECTVRRQVFWHQWRPKLRECSAHLVGCIMRRAGGDASVAFRASFV